MFPLLPNRFDPFSNDLSPYPCNSQAHQIPSASPYWVRLREVPYEEVPSNFSIPGYTEVYGTPAAGQFRVDYTYRTGLVEFSSSDAGKFVTAFYRGVGSPITADDFHNLLRRVPSKGMFPGATAGSWIGTHFSIPDLDPNIKPLSGWMHSGGVGDSFNGAFEEISRFPNHYLTFGRTVTGVNSGSFQSVYAQRYVQYRPSHGGGVAMQFRLCYVGNTLCTGANFFAYFGRTGIQSGTDLLFHDNSPTVSSTSVITTPVVINATVQTQFPGWSVLPIGFGWTSAGSKYFCTFTRSTYHTLLMSFRAVAGKMADDDSSLPIATNLLGGMITDVSSYLVAGQWHDVRIELSNLDARLYIDGKLLAIHNTNIPGSIYQWQNEYFIPHLQISLPFSHASAGYFKVDYWHMGYHMPVSPAI